VLIDRRPDLPFGWLLAGAAVLVAAQMVILLPASEAVVHGSRGALARWGLTASSFGFLPIAVQGLINVRFPSGRPATRRGAALEVALVVGTALVLFGGFFGATALGDVVDGSSTITHPLTGGTTVGNVADSLVVLAPVVVLLGLVAGLGVVARFVRARGITRQQLKWRAVGVIAALALFPLAVTEKLGPIDALDSPLFVLTLAIPVLRYRLWAIDTILRRSVAYALITAVLVLGYVAVSAVTARVASDRVAAPMAAAVVAMSFAPLRGRVQRLVDKVFYGDRRDPYRTLRDWADGSTRYCTATSWAPSSRRWRRRCGCPTSRSSVATARAWRYAAHPVSCRNARRWRTSARWKGSSSLHRGAARTDSTSVTASCYGMSLDRWVSPCTPRASPPSS
jgi:two-component system NarL family sensor kinase